MNLHTTKIKPTLLKKYDLHYIEADVNGISRSKRGRGYSFIYPNGQIVKDEKEKQRLKSLAVPPSYEKVWYCPLHNGHLQATGYDSKSKKQYFYHPHWEELREMTKFTAMLEFGKALPSFRRRLADNLKNTELDKETLLCAMARILDRTGMRIGSDLATNLNRTHGLTTLEKKHLSKEDKTIIFSYKGKGNQDVERQLNDAKVTQIIDQCVEIPGQRLFEYTDENNNTKVIDSADLNNYIKKNMGEEFSAKDFRTWRFSCYFIEKALNHTKKARTTLTKILSDISEETGNTPAVLKSSYVHPGLQNIVKEKNWKFLENPKKQITGLRRYDNIFLNYLQSTHADNSL
jgi:DNA topoisomerase-1